MAAAERTMNMKRAYTLQLRTAPLPVMSIEILERFSEVLFDDRRLTGSAASAHLATRALVVRTGVVASGPAEAVSIAVDRAARAARAAGCVGVDFPDITVVLDPDQETNYARDELLSGADVARELGISRERVRQLATTKGHFPSAFARVGSAKLWRYGDIADWLAIGGRRKSGRPRAPEIARSSAPKRHRKRRAA